VIKGFWYCTKEKKENLHSIVGDFSVCKCGYKKKLYARKTESTEGKAADPKGVRKQLRSTDVGTTKVNGYRIAGLNRDSLEFAHLIAKARSVQSRGKI